MLCVMTSESMINCIYHSGPLRLMKLKNLSPSDVMDIIGL